MLPRSETPLASGAATSVAGFPTAAPSRPTRWPANTEEVSLPHQPRAAASRVLLVVFDGLRPDMVTPDRMPALHAFLAGTRRFPEASSVFPSITRVCATAIGTGAPPALNGIVHNGFPDPAARPGRFLDTASADDMRRAAAFHGPDFVAAPRFADALAAAGRRFALVHSGSPGGPFLLDPRAAANGSFVLSLSGRDATETPAAWDRVVERLGPPPETPPPKVAQVEYAGRAMAEVALPELLPDVAMLWLTEPDWSFHYRGLEHPETRAALLASDNAFARALHAAEALPDGERTAVIALSDHGHVGTTEPLDLAAELAGLGFAATLDRPGPDLSVAAGTMCWLWPAEPDATRLARLVEALRERPWCGGLFAAGGNGVEGPFPGTFDLALLNADHPRSAPLLVQLRGDAGQDRWGLPGRSPIVGKDLAPGGGMHGGLHRQEMANVLALRLPGEAARDDARAASLIDLAPTLLGLLGIAPLPGMVGQDLLALDAPPRPLRVLETGAGGYRQSLSRFGEGRSSVMREGGRAG